MSSVLPAPATLRELTRDTSFNEALRTELVWLPERGMGFYPVTEAPYDADYFDKYVAYAATPMGQAITAARVEIVDRYWTGQVVDVGIGCGAFVESRRGRTWGYDINPTGRAWLVARGLWLSPYSAAAVESVSLWDVLEHIPEPEVLLTKVRRWVFVSLPIFTGPDHVLRSRHYRKDEHCWYWTRDGLIQWMASHGFECREHGTPESLLGREDIHSFVFRRST